MKISKKYPLGCSDEKWKNKKSGVFLETLIKELFRYVLPKEIVESFDLVNLQEEEETLHLYLDECNVVPAEHADIKLRAIASATPKTLYLFLPE